jgi:tetratricopeptide (TPR) repeat protein
MSRPILKKIFYRGGIVLLALFVLLFSLEMRLRTVSAPKENAELTLDPTKLTIAVFGDSITLGNPAQGRSYPQFLESELVERGWRVQVVNRAVSGSETIDHLEWLPQLLTFVKPEIVISMTGLGDLRPFKRSLFSEFRVWRLLEILIWPSQGDSGKHRFEGKNPGEIDDGPLYMRYMGQAFERKIGRQNALDFHRKVIALQPNHIHARTALAVALGSEKRLEEAEVLLREALEISRKSTVPEKRYSSAYVLMLIHLSEANRWKEWKALSDEIQRDFDPAYVFWDFIIDGYQKQRIEIRGLLLKALEQQPSNLRIRGLLVAEYLAKGEREKASAESLELEKRRKASFGYQATLASYREIDQLLRSKGIWHLALSYPGRSADFLLGVFPSEPRPIIVESEKEFREALGKVGFDELFLDQYLGDSGHLREPGARLVVDSILPTLLPLLERHFSGYRSTNTN